MKMVVSCCASTCTPGVGVLLAQAGSWNTVRGFDEWMNLTATFKEPDIILKAFSLVKKKIKNAIKNASNKEEISPLCSFPRFVCERLLRRHFLSAGTCSLLPPVAEGGETPVTTFTDRLKPQFRNIFGWNSLKQTHKNYINHRHW